MSVDAPWSRTVRGAVCAALSALVAGPAQAEPTAGVDSPAVAAPPLPRSPSRRAGPDDVDSSFPVAPPPLGRGSEGEAPISAAANFGAPRARLPRPYPPAHASSPRPFSPHWPLPQLEPYATSFVARQASKARPKPPGAAISPPPPTVAAPAAPRRRQKPRVSADPFEPQGVALGSTLVFPFLEATGGYDDNPNRLAPGFNARPSPFVQTEGGVKVKSDWARHSIEGELRGGYVEFFDYANASRPDASGQAAARVEATRDIAFDLNGRLSLDTMRPGAPALFSGQQTFIINRPIMLSVGTQAGPTQKLGRLALSALGTFDRSWYENGLYSDGTILDLARTSYNAYGVLMRAVYEATPELRPFVEAALDRREHDAPTDFNGFYRDSKGFVARGGAAVNVTELIKGEISGGYGERHYADARLTPLRGPVIDAALIYTPSALTTATLRCATSLNETTLADASGALTRSIAATLSHDLMRNLNVTLSGSYFVNDYQGSNVRERGGAVAVKLEYKVTRALSLRGGYRREQLDSSFPNADYTANVYTAGLKFQL